MTVKMGRAASNESSLSPFTILDFISKLQPKECLHNTDEERYCDDRNLYRLLMGHFYLILFVLGIFGNCINLLVYHSRLMRRYIAIRLLSTKVVRIFYEYYGRSGSYVRMHVGLE